jgi:predicted flap endonuclease-1-like 5' DNA nuclease
MYEQDIRLGPGTGTFTQHTFEILIMLFGAFLLGLWLGWILWNRYKQELEKLRLDNQSLKITSDTLMADLTALKTKFSALETDNSNLSTQVVSLNRNNTNLRDRVSQLEAELLETNSRNRQVETELGLTYNPDTLAADDVPLEVVEQDFSETPAETDVSTPVTVIMPPEEGMSIVISAGTTPIGEVIIQDTSSQSEVSIEFQDKTESAEIHNEGQGERSTTTVSLSEPEIMVMGAAAGIQDDLTIVEGIGPKIQMLLNQYGVHTYRQLADTPVERLREILSNAGPQLAMHDPGTWPSQANLAANDQWDALKSIQGFLKGGKKPT